MDTIELTVQGMTCGGCENSVRNAIARVGGVVEVTADHQSGAVVVQTDRPVERASIEDAVEDAGFVVVPQGRGLPQA